MTNAESAPEYGGQWNLSFYGNSKWMVEALETIEFQWCSITGITMGSHVQEMLPTVSTDNLIKRKAQ